MDPNANTLERIAMLRAGIASGDMSAADMDRYMELTAAYTDWRMMGGFAASVNHVEAVKDLSARFAALMAV